MHQLVDALLGLFTGQLGNHDRSTQVVFGMDPLIIFTTLLTVKAHTK